MDEQTQQCEAQYSACEGVGTLLVDPYQADMYDVVVELVLCRSCYEDKLYAI